MPISFHDRRLATETFPTFEYPDQVDEPEGLLTNDELGDGNDKGEVHRASKRSRMEEEEKSQSEETSDQTESHAGLLEKSPVGLIDGHCGAHCLICLLIRSS